MELLRTDRGNRCVLVFQDYLTKWPMVFPMPDEKSSRIARLLVEEVIPLFGVPEALLSDRGTNLLSHLMCDVCALLGIEKLNTTAYHPQCDGMVERFNHTLKSMIRKHAAKYGAQWDSYLSGLLWAYRNLPHDSTGEKPSYLLFGVDCRIPTEAALMPAHPLEAVEVSDYREELVLSLSTARQMAAESIRRAQKKYKRAYDRETHSVDYQIGDWVLVKFPQEEVGKKRKLSRPWHGPYRVLERRDPDITVIKVYGADNKQIQVHQSRVTPCPSEFPAGYFWYGTRRPGPGRPPRWVQELLEDPITMAEGEETPSPEEERSPDEDDSSPQEDDPSMDVERSSGRMDGEVEPEPESEPSPRKLTGKYLLRPRKK